jgi:hypothetical protein
MGIKKLFTFLDNNKLYKIYPYLSNITNKLNLNKKSVLIGIDGNLYCYKYSHSYDNMIIGFFNQILNFLSNGFIPLYIFDGGTISEKEKTNNLRYHKKYINKLKINIIEEKIIEKNNFEEINNDLLIIKKKLEKNSIRIGKKEIDILIELLDLLNIPYIFSYGEGEYLGVLLNKYNIIDMLLTDDTDPIPGGIDKIIKFYNNNVYYLDINNIFNKFNITYKQLCDFCILLGSDYGTFNHGFKTHELMDLITKYNDIETLIDKNLISNIDIDQINKIRNIYFNSYLNEKNLFINNSYNNNFNNSGIKYHKIIDHDNYNNYSNAMLEYWDEYLEIYNYDSLNPNDKEIILKKSNIFKININNFVRNKKFNIKNIIKFLKNNINDISKTEIDNNIISFEYLNTFGI